MVDIFRRSAHQSASGDEDAKVAGVLKMALRCVGNLSTEDENIKAIVNCQATQCITEAMEQLGDDHEFTQNLLGNLGKNLEKQKRCERGRRVLNASAAALIFKCSYSS